MYINTHTAHHMVLYKLYLHTYTHVPQNMTSTTQLSLELNNTDLAKPPTQSTVSTFSQALAAPHDETLTVPQCHSRSVGCTESTPALCTQKPHPQALSW